MSFSIHQQRKTTFTEGNYMLVSVSSDSLREGHMCCDSN